MKKLLAILAITLFTLNGYSQDTTEDVTEIERVVDKYGGKIADSLSKAMETATPVAKEEFGAKGALKKYEWFKDASETIDEKRQTIQVYEKGLEDLKKSYIDIPRSQWDNIDKQQYNQWSMEITGIKASYNKVVKEYNSQSNKFNWKVYNTDKLPETYNIYISK